ncbi:flagellar hook-length control protein FliK [Vibrio sp. TRT 21S02]|uniref:flagellar hook-length control protein FliK n=1 Tax=Vibrio sp. TRT 21S02 TaxID=3418507 RepID=UPI003CE71EEB
MNVNLTPTTETPKVGKVAIESGETSAEPTEEQGFFAKLSAFIKGETTAKGEVSEDSKIEADTASQTNESEESTDALLKQAQAEGEDLPVEVDGDAESIDVDSAKRLTNENKSEAVDENIDDIMSEGDELLGRLNEANQALKSKDGKALPPEDVQQLDNEAIPTEDVTKNTRSKTVDVDDDTLRPLKDVEGVESSDLASDSKEPQVKEQPVIPESAKRFVQQSDLEAVNAEESSSKVEEEVEQQVRVMPATASVDEGEPVEQVSMASTSEVEKGKPLEQQLDTPVTEQEQSSDVPDMVTVASPVAQKQLDAESAETTPEEVSVAMAHSDAALNTVAQPIQQAAESVTPAVAATTVTATAIPWSSSSNEKIELDGDDAVALDGKNKHNQMVAQQAALNQQSNQQAYAQLAAIDKAAITTQNLAPVEHAATNAVSQMMAGQTSPLVNEQAALQAAMGAKAAANIGKLAHKEGGQIGQVQQEHGLAQQLSQLTGQQTTSNSIQARAEQAVAQTPMQLNREMASDQVAERVQMMMSKNLKNIDIRLDPPELGRLQIRMNMNGDGAAVHFTVANQQARDIIEQSMPRLREMLAQQGVQLGDTSVQQQSSGQQNRYAAGNQGESGQGGGNQSFSGDENLEPDVKLDLNVSSKRDGISYYA